MSFSSNAGRVRGRAASLLLVILVFSGTAYGGDGPPPPSPRDRCPVCGMFVAKYPDWVSTIVHDDGRAVYFDGVKDMMKYYFNIARYDHEKTKENISSIYVKSYYDMEVLPVASVTFVLGSDVLGPMGKELIPLRGEAEVGEFIRDHGGEPVAFGDITVEMIP